MTDIPKIHVKNRFQKRSTTYQDILTDSILVDITRRITGLTSFEVVFDEVGYNRGRLLTLEWQGRRSLVSLSETSIMGRNSAFQSIGTAVNRYLVNTSTDKELCFYFLPDIAGNFQTAYFKFLYRLLATIGVKFLNPEFLSTIPAAFIDARNIELARASLQALSRGNRSSYLTRGSGGQVQIYGKTYGASKYETTLIAAAVASIEKAEIELYEVAEGGLTKLPRASLDALNALGGIRVITASRTFEESIFEAKEEIRSPKFIYNLLEHLGPKKCEVCECTVPEIIQGAHVWPISEIKSQIELALDEKIAHAVHQANGLWLCENHHKLFDRSIIVIDDSGKLGLSVQLDEDAKKYLESTTTVQRLSDTRLSTEFLGYLKKRNDALATDFSKYQFA